MSKVPAGRYVLKTPLVAWSQEALSLPVSKVEPSVFVTLGSMKPCLVAFQFLESGKRRSAFGFAFVDIHRISSSILFPDGADGHHF